MKKTLLTALFGLASVFGGLAETMEYSYGGELNQIAGVTRKAYYSVAMELPASFCEANKGAKITSLSMGFGRGVNKEGTMFVTKELGETPLATVKNTALQQDSFNEFKLSEPVVLDGSTLYVGFTYYATSTTDMPIGFDTESDTYISIGDYVSITSKEEDLWNDDNFGEFGSSLGNMCIRATLEADAFASNMVMPYNITLPGVVRPWNEFDFTVSMTNMGKEPVNSVEVEYKLGGADLMVKTFNFETPLAPGATGVATFTGLNNQDGEVDLRAVACVAKVNGNPNAFSEVNVTTKFSPNSKLFERRVVLEEYTGIGCGFCPRGWYGIEEFSKKVDDGSFIAIGVHNYGNGGDPMYVSAYNSWANQYISGAPQGTINRSADKAMQQFNPGLSEIEAAYTLYHTVCEENVQISSVQSEDGDNVIATTTMQFAKDIKNGSYGLAYVLTQDHLGPYMQSNYYAGGSYGPMGGFENLGSVTPLEFNDVARDIYNWSGDRTAVPTNIVRGETYTHEKTMSLSRCKTLAGADLKNVNVIVLLINRSTGEIVNAAKCPLGGESIDAVEKVTDDAPSYTVRALQGRIAVDGEYSSVALYTADGARAGLYSAGQTINVPAGLYLVSVDGDKAVKVVVR